MREKNFNLIGLPGPMEDLCSYIGWSVLCTFVMCSMLTAAKKIRDSKKEEKKEEK